MASTAPSGRICVELTRVFVNVIDLEGVELLNATPADLADLKRALAPTITASQPPFFMESECDGELLVRLPFAFSDRISWELTHLRIDVSHPPDPRSRPPRSALLLVNQPDASFDDFIDSNAAVLDLREDGKGFLVASLEAWRARGTFKRVVSIALLFLRRRCGGVAMGGEDSDDADGDGDGTEVYFNGIAVFGVPGDKAAGSGRVHRRHLGDVELIVNPEFRRTVQTETAGDAGGDDDGY